MSRSCRLASRTIAPCLPRPAKEPPSGPGWIHEIKHDGLRILARRDAHGRVKLFTKNGYDFADRFPLIVAGIKSLQLCYDSVDAPLMEQQNSRYKCLRDALGAAHRTVSGWSLRESTRPPPTGGRGRHAVHIVAAQSALCPYLWRSSMDLVRPISANRTGNR